MEEDDGSGPSAALGERRDWFLACGCGVVCSFDTMPSSENLRTSDVESEIMLGANLELAGLVSRLGLPADDERSESPRLAVSLNELVSLASSTRPVELELGLMKVLLLTNSLKRDCCSRFGL